VANTIALKKVTPEEFVKIRRQARAIALQALYEIDCSGHPADQALNHLAADENLSEEGVAFATNIVQGIRGCSQQLDAIIAKHAPEWPVDQLAIVDRNILRIALYELQYNEDVPIKVAINEAVELAKMFGSDTAPRFVNGVLGTFLQAHPAGELRH
jgi:N utilization substance protein B